MKFEEALYNKRTEKQITQQELADALFVTRQTVSRWETGKNYPTLDMLVEICRVLDLDATDIFPSKTIPSPEIKDVPFLIKIICLIVGIFLTGVMYIAFLIFGKVNDVACINRYNPFISKHTTTTNKHS